jgi:hypothetical protein
MDTWAPATGARVSESTTWPVTKLRGLDGEGGRLKFSAGWVSPELRVPAKKPIPRLAKVLQIFARCVPP